VPEQANALYFDPDADAVVSQPVDTLRELDALVERITLVRSGRGCPSLELQRRDGSTLALGTDGSRACLMWVDSLGDSFHSIGGPPGSPLVYDYMGSWTEAPSEWTVPLLDAQAVLHAFLRDGAPSNEPVVFEAE
jgi:hypothetical protein